MERKRKSRHQSLDRVDPGDVPIEEPRGASLAWLHEEVNRLPEKYRIPIILCYFEGLTHEEASDQLRWPLGTIKGRLSHAKELLRRRIGRDDVGLDEQSLLTPIERGAIAPVVPQLLLARTIRSALAVAGKDLGALAGGAMVSQSILDLVQGALHTMKFSQIRAWRLPGLLGLGAALTGASVIAFQGSEPTRVIDAPKAVPKVTPSTKPPTEKPDRANPTGDAAPFYIVNTPVTIAAQPPSGGKPSQKPQPQPVKRGDDGDSPLLGTDMASGFIRQHNAQLAQKIAQADPNPKSKAVLKTLDEPIGAVFPFATPLEDVLKYLQAATETKESPGIPIYVDPRGLEDVNESFQSTVIINLEGIPLRTILHLTLKQLHLAYCIRDGVVVISSVRGIKQELEQLAAELEIPVPEFKMPPGWGGGRQPQGIVGPMNQK